MADTEDALREAIAHNAHDLVAINALGNLCWGQGRIDEAALCYRQVLDLDPRNHAALLNLGNVLVRQGSLRAAAGLYEQGLKTHPGSPDLRFGLASTLSSLGFQARAVEIFAEIDREQPDLPGLQVNLGLALMKLGRCEEAIARYDRAIAANPDDYMAFNNRGNALQNQQRMDEAVSSYHRALAIKPDHARAHSNLLLILNYIEKSQEAIYRESLRFDAQQAATLLPAMPAFRNVRTTDRVLRVGYVSADFRQHSVAFFLKGIVAAHDRRQVRVYCYANVLQPDAVTTEFEALSDQWRPIAGLSDDAMAEQIRADEIDILVDLGGHTGGNRLLVFARKPAPVQVSWLGYPNTTGMQAMDFRLTDSIADPVGEADALHSEKLIRLPHGFLCYQPSPGLPDPHLVPGPGRPQLTFGSFNTLSKITPEVIRVWSEILSRTPGSRLLLKSEALDDAATTLRFLEMFSQHGIAADRLELIAWMPDHLSHMQLYSRIDIALDPFPYNGTTTTFEALWMGVPVVALRGSRHAARVGASILLQAGLPEWVAEDEGGYVELAATRALDRVALAASRATVRNRMRASVLMDCPDFTRNLERAYREMWFKWCT